MTGVLGKLACFLWLGLVANADAACRQALALGLDVSGSVDLREYRLQMGGLAEALADPRVKSALLAFPQAPVDLLVYEWSGPEDHVVVLPWTRLKTEAHLNEAIDILRNTERRVAAPGTALGMAMRVGVGFLRERSDCERLTLDVSGDGKSNLGPRPQDVRDALERSGITINGLVIGSGVQASLGLRDSEIQQLSAYFHANVLLGPDAFVETALSYSDYADAIKRKLLREIETIILSDAAQ